MPRHLPSIVGLCLVLLLAAFPTTLAEATISRSAQRTLAGVIREAAFRQVWRFVTERFPSPADDTFIVIDAARQRLYLFATGQRTESWPVSTAVAGLGERNGSLQTPTGLFRIVEKIGQGLPPLEIFQDRRPSGRLAQPVFAAGDLAASHFIVGRILRLEGLEPGWNEGGAVDTYNRYIYIHGTPNIGMLGKPASEGCIQMAPDSVAALFGLVSPGTPVLITAGSGNLVRIAGLASNPSP